MTSKTLPIPGDCDPAVTRRLVQIRPTTLSAALGQLVTGSTSLRVDPSSHNANPPGVFDGEAVLLSDVADTRIEESVAALRDFVAEHGSIPTAESWTEAAMRPSEKTIRRRFGSFREAIKRAALT